MLQAEAPPQTAHAYWANLVFASHMKLEEVGSFKLNHYQYRYWRDLIPPARPEPSFGTKETETRAEAKVLGQPRILQVTERQAMIKAVVAVHGQLGESETPSAEYLALKCEECEVNEPQASTLDAITSKKSTLTTSIQSSLDASGRIHITQHKAKSELPTTTEAYRKVLRVEAFTWLCMAARFKSKQWLQGLKLSDFDHFVNYILGEKVAQLNVPTSHQPNDVPTLSPPWHVVLAYEHRLRKEAFRLVNEEDQTLSAALATVISSAELKEAYFTTPLALSIIERPRKWYKGKGKDKDGKGLGRDPKGGHKGKDDKGGRGARLQHRILRSRASLWCGARQKAVTSALRSTRRAVPTRNASAFTCVELRVAIRSIRLGIISRNLANRRSDYRLSSTRVFPPSKHQSTCLISRSCIAQLACVCFTYLPGLIAKVMWALFFMILDTWTHCFNLICSVLQSMI